MIEQGSNSHDHLTDAQAEALTVIESLQGAEREIWQAHQNGALLTSSGELLIGNGDESILPASIEFSTQNLARFINQNTGGVKSNRFFASNIILGANGDTHRANNYFLNQIALYDDHKIINGQQLLEMGGILNAAVGTWYYSLAIDREENPHGVLSLKDQLDDLIENREPDSGSPDTSAEARFFATLRNMHQTSLLTVLPPRFLGILKVSRGDKFNIVSPNPAKTILLPSSTEKGLRAFFRQHESGQNVKATLIKLIGLANPNDHR